MSAKKLIGATVVAFLLSSGVAFAQTGTSSTTTTPGTPNTGAGGVAATTLAVLGGTLAVALAGIAALSRQRLLQ